jgi:hypothetical protein
MTDKNLGDLRMNQDNATEKESSVKEVRAIIDIGESWSWGQRLMGNIVNALPTVLWALVTVALLYFFQGNAELVGLSTAYMNLVVPATAYGILSLSAGLTLISWFFPYFSYRRIVREGTPEEKKGCMQFWGAIAIALAIIIASVA